MTTHVVDNRTAMPTQSFSDRFRSEMHGTAQHVGATLPRMRRRADIDRLYGDARELRSQAGTETYAVTLAQSSQASMMS